VLSIIMGAIAHLTKIVAYETPDTVDRTTFETWTIIEGVDGPQNYEVVDLEEPADPAALITELEGRADIEYV